MPMSTINVNNVGIGKIYHFTDFGDKKLFKEVSK